MLTAFHGNQVRITRIIVVFAIAYAAAYWLQLISREKNEISEKFEQMFEERWSSYLHHNYLLYEKMLVDRKERLARAYNDDLNFIIPFDGLKETYLWDFFPPAYNCPFRERIGRFSDGGKVVCNWQALLPLCHNREDGIVYSFGVRDDTSFEEEFVALTACHVLAFDPTVPMLPSGADLAKIHFEPVGLGPSDMMVDGLPLQTLQTIMKRNGHDRIHLLKVDCEGCEWDVFESLGDSGILEKVDQILIELHFKQKFNNTAGPDSGVHDVFKFFELVEKSGLLPFSWEVNHNPSGYFSQKPWAIEYSFVRPDSLFMAQPPKWLRQ